MSALPRPDLPPGPHRDLVDALHDLHHRAGWPSLRALAADTGVSHTTVSKAFSSPSLPAWGTLELLIEALSGDLGTFHEQWLTASTPRAEEAQPAPRIAGRRTELATVRRHLEGGSGLLLVTGEAGIGKTKLVTTAAQTAEGYVAKGHCLPLSTEVPFLPLVDVLRGIHDHDDGRWLKEALGECPDYMREALARLVPELGSPEGPLVADDPWGRQRLFVSTAAVLRSLAATGTLSLLFEDLHWADSGTLDLVQHLLSGSPPLAMVGTWRDRDPGVAPHTTAGFERLVRHPAVAVLPLAPLDRDGTAEHLGLMAGRPPTAELVDHVHRRSGGIPFFSEQLVSSGADPDELPPVLSKLLDRRLDALDGDAWVVVRLLAVADRPLGSPALARASGVDPTSLSGVLHLLQRDRLVRSAGQDLVALHHPLLAEAIRKRLIGVESMLTHRAIADVLAEEDGEPGEIARHWAAVGDDEQELRWRVRAARRSQTRSAWPLERVEWSRVLELWPPGTTLLTDPPVSLGEVYDRAILLAEIAADVSRGLALAHRAAELDLPASERAALLSRAGGYEVAIGDPAQGIEWLTEAIRLAEPSASGTVLADTLVRRGMNLAHRGRFAEAEQDLDRAHELARESGDPLHLRRTLSKVAWLQGVRGRIDLALERAAEGWSIAVEDPDPFADLLSAIDHTDLLLHAEQPPEALLEVAAGPLEASDRWGIDPYAASVLRWNLCESLLRAGAVASAGAVVDPHTEGEIGEVDHALHLARACVDTRRGRLEEALARFATVDRVLSHDEVRRSSPESINRAEDDLVYADAELWAARPADAARRLGARIPALLSTDWALDAARFVRTQARATADLATSRRAGAAERAALRATLVDAVSAASHDPFGPAAVGRAAAAHAATWRAEVARVAGTERTSDWVGAATEWDRLTRPHDAAYCRWRAAQVSLREGQGTIAARLLKRAASDAREHVPLSEAIATTAAGAG